jgi:hypothetical protein
MPYGRKGDSSYVFAESVSPPLDILLCRANSFPYKKAADEKYRAHCY